MLGSSSTMFSNSVLRAEALSCIFGQEVKPYDNQTNKTREHIVSLQDFHLREISGKRFIDERQFFDPQYDCDFTHLSDSAECMRGDKPYERPNGWYRMALKVRGKYPDGDAWLGPEGLRSHSVPGEWPVSYHGTSSDGARGIIKSEYKAGDRVLYGRGIYSTPDIRVAEQELYARTFQSEKTGIKYKVILQNRFHPERVVKCRRPDYWLIPVAEGTTALEEKEIVRGAIRPYGILIKEIKKPY